MNKIKTALVTLDNCTLNDALAKTQSLANSEGSDYIVTPNIDHLTRLVIPQEAKTLQPIYDNASLNLCDSRILEKILKLKGHTVKEVIPGSTLTQKLFGDVLNNNSRILVVGGNEDVISRLKAKYHHLTIQHYNPPMGFINKLEEVNKTLDVIKSSNAQYVFLAVGSPRQEVLAKLIKDHNLINGVALCIGASILFLVGEEKRAPKILQTLHLEWAYRMMQDPKRLVKRYFDNFLKLPKLYVKL